MPRTKTCNVQVIPAKEIPKEQAKKKLRAAAYARVSTEQEEQQSSYEAQIQYYTEKIKGNAEWVFAGIYADEGITGTMASKRPSFMRMVRDCEHGKIDLILTKSLSRFARNTLDSIGYVRKLKALGIPILFEKENINTMTIDSEMLLTLLSCMAQAESESISMNVRWGYRQAFKNGLVLYNYKHWYGYEKGMDGQPKIIPEQAEIVELIFKEYLSGSSILQIKQQLEAKGIKKKNGSSVWPIATIQSMLRNEKYCGDAIQQKTYTKDCLTHTRVINNGELPKYYIPDNHPAIIDREIFNRVQEEIARRCTLRKLTTKPTVTECTKYSARYALTGILVCGQCGTAYRRVTWARNGQKKVVWRCISRLEHGKTYCRESCSLEEERLHKGILSAMRQLTNGMDHLKESLLQNIEMVAALIEGKPNRSALEAQLKEKKSEMLDLVAESVRSGDAGMYEQRFKTLGEEIEGVKQRLAELDENEERGSKSEKQLIEAEKVIEDNAFTIQNYDDRLVRKLVERVYVVSKSEIRIVFKGGYEVEQEI